MQYRAIAPRHHGPKLHPSRKRGTLSIAAGDAEWAVLVSQMIEDGSIMGKVGFRWRKVAATLHARRMLVPCHGRQAGLDVVGVPMSHRANDREPVDDFAALWQKFAHSVAGDSRCGIAKFAADLSGSLGLGVPRFVLRVPTV